MPFIDLRSDTVTRPTAAMRAAMANAEVGDDVFGDDPTAQRLEAMAAEILGKEAALFVPSGTLGNQICIKLHTEPGDELIIEARGHSFAHESGATAALAGVQCRPISTTDGRFGPQQLLAAIRPDSISAPRSRLVIVEQTHNAGGGTVWNIEDLRGISALAGTRGLAVHMDGARLWNAAAASGVSEKEFASVASTVSVCLSKGLGAPIGSVIAGSKDAMIRARRIRKMYGAGMRQVGILAAAGIYALTNHRVRIAEDHARARDLAAGLRGAGLVPNPPATNMVFVMPPMGPAPFLAKMREEGVLAGDAGDGRVRFVTHLDVDDAGVAKAVEAATRVMG